MTFQSRQDSRDMLFLPGGCTQVWGTQYVDVSGMYKDLDLRDGAPATPFPIK